MGVFVLFTLAWLGLAWRSLRPCSSSEETMWLVLRGVGFCSWRGNDAQLSSWSLCRVAHRHQLARGARVAGLLCDGSRFGCWTWRSMQCCELLVGWGIRLVAWYNEDWGLLVWGVRRLGVGFGVDGSNMGLYHGSILMHSVASNMFGMMRWGAGQRHDTWVMFLRWLTWTWKAWWWRSLCINYASLQHTRGIEIKWLGRAVV